MRTAFLATSLFLAGCALTSTTEPYRPAIQISIPSAPGWNFQAKEPNDDDALLYDRFLDGLSERMDSASEIITAMTYQRPSPKLVIVTLTGDQPDQIIGILMPYLKQSHLPDGTQVVKYWGEHGQKRESVAF